MRPEVQSSFNPHQTVPVHRLTKQNADCGDLTLGIQTKTYSPAMFPTVTRFSVSIVSIFFNCTTSGSGAPETGVPSEVTRWAASGLIGSDGLGAFEHEQRAIIKSNVIGLVRDTIMILLSYSNCFFNKGI
jgi:hypothetical protein